jgi:hypothetical protein
VIFEWSPIQYRDCGTDVEQPFEVLDGCGYRRFAFYEKAGTLHHVQDGIDRDRLRALAEACERTRGHRDEYFDVVALVPDSS